MTVEHFKHTFHPDSRVWVYQSNREFTTSETETINEIGDKFVAEWTAHGSKLKATFQIRYNRFLIVIVDESQAMASGCSIDKSVELVRKIENSFNVILLDRMLVAYRKNGTIHTTHLSDFTSELKMNGLDSTTIVFNNLVQTVKELDNNWEVPLKDSWHNRFL